MTDCRQRLEVGRLIYIFEGCELDVGRVVLHRDRRQVRLEPQVFDLLCCLIERRGTMVRKDELLDAVWGDRFVSEAALTTRIKAARQAVGDDGTSQRIIRTVHGKGYEFVADVTIVETAPAATSSVASRGATALPAQLERLIGRDEEIDRLIDEIGAHRLMTLVGTAGVGKTSIAYEVARRVAGKYPHGTFLVELVTVADEDAAVEAFATALEVSTRQHTSIGDAIVEMLAPRTSLVVLDNCEHLIDPIATLVDRILRHAPHVHVLATSREPLAVAGEHVWPVQPLSVDRLEELDADVASAPAVALFVERARAVDPHFELTETTVPAVVEICRRLDGIPLAIELAAARVGSLDVAEIARRLDERFQLLKSVRRNADRRHRALHDAISWSYELLDADEKRLFAALSVFSGQFDLGAAESLRRGDEVLEPLTGLVQRSMISTRRPPSGGTRYEILETLREFGRSRLEDGERIELATVHADLFASLARSVEADLRTPQEPDAMQRGRASFADLRAAQRFALDAGDLDVAYSLIASIREYAMRSLQYEVFGWADAACRAAGGDGHPMHATLLGISAYGAWVRGEFDRAVELAHATRESEQRNGTAPSGLVERALANVFYTTGRGDEGMAESRREVELARESGDDSRLAHAAYMASVAATSVGYHGEAERLSGLARQVARRTGSPTDLASAAVAEGFATRADDAAALDAFATADRLARAAGNRWMSAFARTEAAGLMVHLGRLEEGSRALALLVDTWSRAGEWAQQWHTLSRCVVALARLGETMLCAEVIGAIEAHAAIDCPPVMVTLHDSVFQTRGEIEAELGAERCAQALATGATQPIATTVERTCVALLGSTSSGVR